MAFLSGWGISYCHELFADGASMNSDHNISTLRSVSACVQVCLTRNTSDVLFLRDDTRQRKVCFPTEHIENFGWTGFPPPPYSPDLPKSDYYLLGPLTKFRRENRHSSDGSLQKVMSQWLEGTTFTGRECVAVVPKWGKIADQRWRLHWKTDVLRTVVVNFRELSKRPTCKWLEKEKQRHYSLTQPGTSRIK
jgi:hypothetical protein